MKTIVIYYSLTGNNQALAQSVAAELSAEHIQVIEPKPRTMLTVILDVIFNRTPQVSPSTDKIAGNDLVVFVGPVWMGQAATPLRAYFQYLKDSLVKYAFVSISGGADGPNPKLFEDLTRRTGQAPMNVIDLHIADLLPSDPKPTRKDTSAYHVTEVDVKNLTEKVVKTLRETSN